MLAACVCSEDMLLPHLNKGPSVRVAALAWSLLFHPTAKLLQAGKPDEHTGLSCAQKVETKPKRLIYKKSMELPSMGLEHPFGLLRGPLALFPAPRSVLSGWIAEEIKDNLRNTVSMGQARASRDKCMRHSPCP